MHTGASNQHAQSLWKPHPDDEDDVHSAMEAVEQGNMLSLAASESFVQWLEGGNDESWRAESG